VPAWTVRNLLMPAAALILVVVVGGLVLFGTRALPAIVLALGAILAGAALLVALSPRRHT
jgi:hypothetical protein